MDGPEDHRMPRALQQPDQLIQAMDTTKKQLERWMKQRPRTKAEREAFWQGMTAMGEPLDVDYMNDLLRILKLI